MDSCSPNGQRMWASFLRIVHRSRKVEAAARPCGIAAWVRSATAQRGTTTSVVSMGVAPRSRLDRSSSTMAPWSCPLSRRKTSCITRTASTGQGRTESTRNGNKLTTPYCWWVTAMKTSSPIGRCRTAGESIGARMAISAWRAVSTSQAARVLSSLHMSSKRAATMYWMSLSAPSDRPQRAKRQSILVRSPVLHAVASSDSHPLRACHHRRLSQTAQAAPAAFTKKGKEESRWQYQDQSPRDAPGRVG
mmetsp:Transcript_63534/g.148153  ORF Transcript_63534/g.148153 Transcript_63534/m.148153 type:complete len:248 (-) Transcript_63534:162-905(-)